MRAAVHSLVTIRVVARDQNGLPERVEKREGHLATARLNMVKRLKLSENMTLYHISDNYSEIAALKNEGALVISEFKNKISQGPSTSPQIIKKDIFVSVEARIRYEWCLYHFGKRKVKNEICQRLCFLFADKSR